MENAHLILALEAGCHALFRNKKSTWKFDVLSAIAVVGSMVSTNNIANRQLVIFRDDFIMIPPLTKPYILAMLHILVKMAGSPNLVGFPAISYPVKGLVTYCVCRK